MYKDWIEESDRGCVIVATAGLDSALEQLFSIFFSRNKFSAKLIKEMFDGNGALATFSSKCKLARAIGAISDSSLADLELIRKLRNDFAHSTKEVDFSDAKIALRVERLSFSKEFSDMRRVKLKIENKKVNDKQVRLAGYVKYHKSVFLLCVQRLELQIKSEWLKFLKNQNHGTPSGGEGLGS